VWEGKFHWRGGRCSLIEIYQPYRLNVKCSRLHDIHVKSDPNPHPLAPPRPLIGCHCGNRHIRICQPITRCASVALSAVPLAHRTLFKPPGGAIEIAQTIKVLPTDKLLLPLFTIFCSSGGQHTPFPRFLWAPDISLMF